VIRYDEHAKFQIERRAIAKAWIEDANPQSRPNRD